ncbi:amidohydrolase family protein [Lactiplantibacillus herbarum]|uniref:amidohydrolase family protein n=1 Tax=Lactiplantibacillus herbarum TaxID=1670446 RepID=UPI00064FF1D9|nr:amidohydrolase family protein [Lactiplantibacillus herbarum]
MKLITTEEHFESAVVTTKIQDITGVSALPPISPELRQYMQTNLPSPSVMQDVDRERLAFMDKNGIDMEILSYGNSSPQNLEPEQAISLCQLANDEMARAIAKHPTRYRGLAVLPVGNSEAAATELERAVTELGLKGVLLKGNYQGRFFDEPFFLPIFEQAMALDVPVYFHPSFIPQSINDHYFKSDQWSPVITGILSSAGYGWHMDIGIQVLRMVVSGIFDRLPQLKLITGHWGELVPLFLERLDDELTAYGDLQHPFSYYYRQNIYATPSGILSEPQLQFMLAEMGADHLMYSLDYPYKRPQNAADFLQTVQLTSRQREQIAHGTAEQLFKL